MSEEDATPHRASEVVLLNRYKMDDLLIDVERCRVSRDGRDLRLGRMAFNLLLVLVQAAPEVVSVAALTKQLWPDFPGAHENLVRRITAVRAALGDDARTARYIVSVRGQGYKIAVRVQPVANTKNVSGPTRLLAVLRIS